MPSSAVFKYRVALRFCSLHFIAFAWGVEEQGPCSEAVKTVGMGHLLVDISLKHGW